MNCKCHDEPAYWHRDPRRKNGGYWRCRGAKQAHHERHQAKKVQRQRDRYDADPIYRITKRLHDDAHSRRLTIQRAKEDGHR